MTLIWNFKVCQKINVRIQAEDTKKLTLFMTALKNLDNNCPIQQ